MFLFQFYLKMYRIKNRKQIFFFSVIKHVRRQTVSECWPSRRTRRRNANRTFLSTASTAFRRRRLAAPLAGRVRFMAVARPSDHVQVVAAARAAGQLHHAFLGLAAGFFARRPPAPAPARFSARFFGRRAAAATAFLGLARSLATAPAAARAAAATALAAARTLAATAALASAAGALPGTRAAATALAAARALAAGLARRPRTTAAAALAARVAALSRRRGHVVTAAAAADAVVDDEAGAVAVGVHVVVAGVRQVVGGLRPCRRQGIAAARGRRPLTADAADAAHAHATAAGYDGRHPHRWSVVFTFDYSSGAHRKIFSHNTVSYNVCRQTDRSPAYLLRLVRPLFTRASPGNDTVVASIQHRQREYFGTS